MRKRKESAADNLREGVASLYRGLEEKNTSDQTYEKERLAVLSKLKLVPDEIVTECLGATSQFNSATAGLGLFARNRRTRKELEPKKTEKKSHKLVTLEKQNLRKRLQYSKRLNQIVKQMGVMLQDDVEIPVQLWTEYDRLQRDPGLKQRTVEDLDLGPSGRTPGPGQYAGKRDVNRKKGSIKEKGERVQITFGRSERWRDNAIKKKKDEGEEVRNDIVGGTSWSSLAALSNPIYFNTGFARRRILTRTTMTPTLRVESWGRKRECDGGLKSGRSSTNYTGSWAGRLGRVRKKSTTICTPRGIVSSTRTGRRAR